MDIRTPMLRRQWRNPFSPTVYWFRTTEGVAGAYRNALIQRRKNLAESKTMHLDSELSQSFSRLLTIIAADIIQTYGRKGISLMAIQARFISEEVPPFSEMKNASFKAKELDSFTVNWFTPDPTIE